MNRALQILLFGGQFSPLRLFRAGEQGAWYDPSDFSTMYQDSAGTTPVTAVGQPVGRINDKSGRGNHATQATAASRPTEQTDSLELDGVDDSLTSATGGGGTTGFFFCAAVRVGGGAGTARYIWNDRTVNSGHVVFIDTTNQLTFSVGNGSVFTPVSPTDAVAVGDTVVITCWDDGVNLNAQVNSGTIASAPRPAVSAGTAGFTIGKRNDSAASFFNGRIFSPIYRHGTPVDATTRERVKRYVAARAGIAL